MINNNIIKASNSKREELSYLIEALKNQSPMSGWDIITSYSINQLNDLLKIQYDEENLIDVVEINTKTYNLEEETDYPLVVRLEIGAPLLQFIASEARLCNVIMPIKKGTYSVNNKNPKPLPENAYNIIATVPIVAISGDTGKVQPSKEPIVFSKCIDEVNHVILHFKNENARFDIKVKEGKEYVETEMLKMCIVPKLKGYFSDNVKEIAYELASINNYKPNNDVTLQPETFIFTTTGDEEDGTLSLYISTVGRTNSNADKEPVFKYNNQKVNLIPQQHTASIIFSKDLISSKYILEQINKLGTNIVEATHIRDLYFNIKVNKNIIKHSEHKSIWDTFSVDDIDISLKKVPIILEIKDGIINVSWNFTQVLSWGYTPPFTSDYQWGKFELSITMNKMAPLQIENEKISGKIVITPNDYKINTKPITLKWYDNARGGRDSLPRELEARYLHIDFPNTEIDLGSLGFFPITNLLFPGQQIIKIDKIVGVKVPKDLMIVGNLVKGINKTQIYSNTKKLDKNEINNNELQSKNAQIFIEDLLSNDSIMSEIFSIVANENSCNLYNWFEENNYSVDGKSLQKCIEDLTINCNLKVWGGKYKINSPSYLEGKIIEVDSKTGEIKLDNKDVNVLPISNSSAWWQLDNKIYRITFEKHSDEEDNILENTFKGSINKENDILQSEEFTGVQYFDDESKKSWYSSTPATIIYSLIGTLAFLGSIAIIAYNMKLKNERIKKAQKIITEHVNNIFDESPLMDTEVMEVVEPQITKELKRFVVEELQKEYHSYSDNDWDDFLEEDVMEDIKERFKNSFEKIMWETVQAQASVEYGTNFMKMIDKSLHEKYMMENLISPKYKEVLGDETRDTFRNTVATIAFCEYRLEKLNEEVGRIEKSIESLQNIFEDNHKYIEDNLSEYKIIQEKYSKGEKLTDKQERLRKEIKEKMTKQEEIKQNKLDAEKDIKDLNKIIEDVDKQRKSNNSKAREIKRKIFKI